MKTTWKKIGEVTAEAPWWSRYNYGRYAIMEGVCANGDRKYKRVLMCGLLSSYDSPILESEPEDPLKEINDILKS